MLKNYLIIALRSISRNKVFSLINIFGLALGIACCFLIAHFVKDEFSFDTFHKNSSQIYRAYVKEDYGENEVFFNTVTPFPLGPTLKNSFPEIEHAVRVNPVNARVKTDGDPFPETITLVDQDFFSMFDFPLITGTPSNLLRNANDLVLTKATAEKLFGTTNVVNKTISIELNDAYEPFTITGVTEDPPANSSVRYQYVISSLNFPKLYRERTLTSGWFNVTPETYVMLRSGSNFADLTAKFPSVFKSILGEDFEKSKYFVGLQPLTDIHLNVDFPQGNAPVSNPKYAYILSAVSALLLFLACINFITLSIGKTIKRAKEVGIRKVIGAQRAQLITQFIGEALVITMLGLAFGIAMASVFLPLFNDLSGKTLELKADLFTFTTGISLIIVIGLFAGSYPAFVLSGFRPVTILKGRLQGSNKQLLRKVLVSVQLVLSIFLISSTMVMRSQLEYLQSKDLGFNKDQLVAVQITVPSVGRLSERVAAAFEKAELFKQELNKTTSIQAVTAGSHDFGKGDWTEIGYTDDNGTYRKFYTSIVDDSYLSAMKMELVEGRDFSTSNPNDARRSVIVNESFVKEYGWTAATGKKIPGKEFIDHEIIGVVKDFNYASLYTKVQPLVLAMNTEIPFSGSENVNFNNSPVPKLFVRTEAGKAAESIQKIEAAWKKIIGPEEFTFSFVDENIQAQYRNDQNLSKIINIATLLSVIIGSMGLYGLASLSIQGRTKEISIRKVLGATVNSLMVLLSGEFVILIVINVILSIPLTLYFMNRWLEGFEYRTHIHWMVFLAGGLIAMMIGLLTVSTEALKVALSKPAEKLKDE